MSTNEEKEDIKAGLAAFRAKSRKDRGIFTDADLARARKAQKSGNALMMELALFAIPGGALIRGGMFAFKVGNKLLKGKQAVEAARKAVSAAKAKSPAKAAQAASVVKNLRAGTQASRMRQQRRRIKAERKPIKGERKITPKTLKETKQPTPAEKRALRSMSNVKAKTPSVKATTPSVKAQTKVKPSGVAAKKPTPPAPKAQGAGTSTAKSNVRAQTSPIKAKRVDLKTKPKIKKGKSTTVGTPSKLKQPTPAQLRAFRSGTLSKADLAALGVITTGIGVATKPDRKAQSASTAAAATTKTQKSPGGKPGPLRGKLPGGKPGPRKSGKTAAQAAAEEAADRKRIREAAKKKKDAKIRKGPVQASDAAKRKPKRPKADQSRPRGGKVTAKRINPSMRDRGRAFQGSYDPKTEVLRNVTVNGKRKTMVFKKKK